MSEYKIRSQRRKRQSYAPYRRKKEQGMVSRMWSWLAPSSWWQRTSPSPSPSPPPPSPPPPPPSLSCDSEPAASSKTSLEETGPSQSLVTADVEHVNGMTTEDMATEGMATDGSWVAEDTGGVGMATEHSVERVINPAYSHTPTVLRPKPKGSGFTSGSRILRPRPLLTSTPQLSPINEVDEQGPPHCDKDSTTPRATYDNRLFCHGNQMEAGTMLPAIPEQSLFHSTRSGVHTTPAVTTPRNFTNLSLSRSPFQSPFYSGRTSYGGAASGQRLAKRARRESSPPVLAPVQRTLTARPHPSAPPLSSLPLSSSTARKILQTIDSLSSPLTDARKLPLRGAMTMTADRQPARKRHKSAYSAATLSPPPLASLSSATTNPSTLAPPLAPPLPPRSSGPVLVPNEKTIRQSTTSRGQSSFLGATLRPGDKITSSTLTSLPATTGGQRSYPAPSSSLSSPLAPPPAFSVTLPPSSDGLLSSLTFSAPPLPSVSPDHSKHSATSTAGMESRPVLNFTPTFHTAISSPLATSGGKMRALMSRTHHSRHHNNQEEEAPVAMVPPVGLKWGDNDRPSLQFSQSIMLPLSQTPATVGGVGATVTTSATTVGGVGATVTTSATTVGNSLNYSFATPKPVTSSSGYQVPLRDTSSPFQFSDPTPCTPTKPQTTPTTLQTTPTNPPALKSVSVVDILKQPAYQALTSRPTLATRTTAGSAVDEKTAISTAESQLSTATPSSVKSATLVPPTGPLNPSLAPLPAPSLVPLPAPSLAPLPAPSLGVGGWECGTCLVQNTTTDKKCVACGSAKPVTDQSSQPVTLFSAQLSGLWECPDCMLQNKPTDDKCPACKASKPGGVASKPGGVAASNQTMGDATAPAKVGGVSHAPSHTPALQLLSQFAPPEGSWSCDTCMVDNKKTDSVCVACGTAKSGTTQQQTPPTSNPTVFGAGGGLSLGGKLKLSTTSPQMGAESSGRGHNTDGGGLKFGGEGLKLGGGGLKLGGGGLKLGGGGINLNGGGLKLGGGIGGGGLKLGGGGLKLDGGGVKFGGGGLKLGGMGLVAAVCESPAATTATTVSGTSTGTRLAPFTDSGMKFGSATGLPAVSTTFSVATSQLLDSRPLVTTAAQTAFCTVSSTAPSTVSGLSRVSSLSSATSMSLTGGLPSKLTTSDGQSTGSVASIISSVPSVVTGCSMSVPSSGLLSSSQTSLSFVGTSSDTNISAATFRFVGEPSNITSSAPSLTVGGKATVSLSKMTTTAPSLSFVGATSEVTTSTPSFTSGQPTGLSLSGVPSTTATSVGSAVATSTAVPSFVFGGQSTATTGLSLTGAPSNTTTAAKFSFTGAPSTATSAPSFVFGADSTSTAPNQSLSASSSLTVGGALFSSPAPSFAFGSSTTPSLSLATTSSAPSFKFGATSSVASDNPFTFSGTTPSTGQTDRVFGQSSSTLSSNTGQTTSQTGFNFGKASSNAPSFVFGSSQPTTTNQSVMFTSGVSMGTHGGRVIRRARRRK